MKWFQGGIPAAIQTARQNKAVFIVFISGGDESSSKMESELLQESVTQLCEENRCVAVKLLSESNDSKFFSQIYPVVVIPSTFFIGDTGVPLEVIGEIKSSEDFFAKVKAAIEMQKNSPSSSQISQPSAVQEEGATSSRSSDLAGSGDDSGPQPLLSDKIDKAQHLLEKRRQDKAMEAYEEQKRKERERRDLGQGVQKLKQTQKEMEILEAKKELKKEKEEDRLARQRVKEDIARDRAEKAARFQTEKDTRTRATEEAKKQKLLEQQTAQLAEQAMRSEIARIQFRLPDGSSLTHQFPATEKFETLYNFIIGHVGSAVKLSTTFPRRTFLPVDHSSSLQELSLAPSATILVIPTGSSSSGVSSSSSGLSLTNIFFAPFIFVWNMIASIFGLGGSSTSTASGSSARQNTAQSTATGGDRKPDGANQRGSNTSRQEGSIHRFHNAQDDEDDEDSNTWNGNSTQQM